MMRASLKLKKAFAKNMPMAFAIFFAIVQLVAGYNQQCMVGVHHNCQFFESDILPRQTFESCMSACSGRAGCQGVVFFQAGPHANVCTLKYQWAMTPAPSGGWWKCGVSDYADPNAISCPVGCMPNVNHNCLNYFAKVSEKAANADECSTKCAQTLGCVGAVYFNSGPYQGNCDFKSNWNTLPFPADKWQPCGFQADYPDPNAVSCPLQTDCMVNVDHLPGSYILDTIVGLTNADECLLECRTRANCRGIVQTPDACLLKSNWTIFPVTAADVFKTNYTSCPRYSSTIAAKTTLTNINYDINGGSHIVLPPSRFVSMIIRNNLTVDQHESDLMAVKKSVEQTITVATSIQVGVSIEAEGGIPFFADNKIQVSASTTFSFENAVAVSKEVTTQQVVDVNVPAKSAVVVMVSYASATLDVPFFAQLSRVYEDGHEVSRIIKGLFHNVDAEQLVIEYQPAPFEQFSEADWKVVPSKTNPNLVHLLPKH